MVTRALVVELGLVLGACSDPVIVVAPVIDGPPPGDPASAFPDLDTIELSIALAGAPDALATTTLRRGQPLELAGVPYGENLVLHMLGRVDGAEVAVGRTCAFSIRADEPPPEPHLYFARTVTWADAVEPPDGVRIAGTALMHRDGSGLFVGGLDAAGTAVRTIDRFDALGGSFESLVELAPRRGGAVAALGDGRVIVVGGTTPDDEPTRLLEVIGVDTNRVDTLDAGPLVGLTAPALATLSDGRIVAIGGLDTTGQPVGQLIELSGEGSGVSLRTLLPG